SFTLANPLSVGVNRDQLPGTCTHRAGTPAFRSHLVIEGDAEAMPAAPFSNCEAADGWRLRCEDRRPFRPEIAAKPATGYFTSNSVHRTLSPRTEIAAEMKSDFAMSYDERRQKDFAAESA